MSYVWQIKPEIIPPLNSVIGLGYVKCKNINEPEHC